MSAAVDGGRRLAGSQAREFVFQVRDTAAAPPHDRLPNLRQGRRVGDRLREADRRRVATVVEGVVPVAGPPAWGPRAARLARSSTASRHWPRSSAARRGKDAGFGSVKTIDAPRLTAASPRAIGSTLRTTLRATGFIVDLPLL